MIIAKNEFRAKFFRETLLTHLSSKQYKRRKNAFYVLNFLIQTDSFFAECALKEFQKVKTILYTADEVGNCKFINSYLDMYSFNLKSE